MSTKPASHKAVVKAPKATRPGAILRLAAMTGVMLLAGALSALTPANAATAPTLGTADSFAVLAGSTVTNTGPSIVSGDLGVSPGSAVVGFPPGIVTNGTIHAGDAVAANAQADALIAYNTLAGQACDQNLSGQDLGGLTLTAGVYCFDSSAQLTGTLTLDAEGDPDAVFIFQIGSTLTTASNSSVVLINGAQACNVFFQVGSSATLGTNTTFVGTIIALTSITANTGTTVEGRLLALNGAVTLDTNTITQKDCAPAPGVAQAPLFGSAGSAIALGGFIVGAGVLFLRRRTRLAEVR